MGATIKKHPPLARSFLTVQALASPGGETALDGTLVSMPTVQTLASCLHDSAAAVHILMVALPTGRIFIYLIIICAFSFFVKHFPDFFGPFSPPRRVGNLSLSFSVLLCYSIVVFIGLREE